MTAFLALAACGEQSNVPHARSAHDDSRASAAGHTGLLVAADTVQDHLAPKDSGRDDVPARDSLPAIVFLGNSLTAGYGLTPEEAYPALIQQKLDSAGYRYRVVNAGVSGETSAGGLRRVDWVLNQPVAVLVLVLGANDALRGQDLSATRSNLQAIIDRTRARHPDAEIVIAGMQVPPNLGRDYTEEFRTMFIELARENDAALIPFLLEGVATVPELNLEDGIHPNAEGQRILAENVWAVLKELL